MGIAQTVVQLWLGTLFLYTGAHKALRPQEAVYAVARYRLVPERVAALVARTTTGGELLAALAILYLPTTLPGGIGTAILGSVFLLASGSAIARRIDTSCGCVGTSSDRRVGMDTVLRAAVILAFGTALAIANAASQIPLGVALAATVAAVFPAVIGVRLTHRAKRRHELELARDVEAIVATLAREPSETNATTPLTKVEAPL